MSTFNMIDFTTTRIYNRKHFGFDTTFQVRFYPFRKEADSFFCEFSEEAAARYLDIGLHSFFEGVSGAEIRYQPDPNLGMAYLFEGKEHREICPVRLSAGLRPEEKAVNLSQFNRWLPVGGRLNDEVREIATGLTVEKKDKPEEPWILCEGRSFQIPNRHGLVYDSKTVYHYRNMPLEEIREMKNSRLLWLTLSLPIIRDAEFTRNKDEAAVLVDFQMNPDEVYWDGAFQDPSFQHDLEEKMREAFRDHKAIGVKYAPGKIINYEDWKDDLKKLLDPPFEAQYGPNKM